MQIGGSAILFTALVLLVATGCSHASVHPVWTSDVSAYRDTDIEIFLAEDQDTIRILLERRNRIESELTRIAPLSQKEVLGMLNSNSEYSREVGLICVIADKKINEETLQIIIERYDPSASFFSRYYSIRVLFLADDELIKRKTATLMMLMVKERDYSVRYNWLPLVPKLATEDALRVTDLYMKTGSPPLQRAVWSIARSMGDEFVRMARDNLEKEKVEDALRLIDLTERGNRTDIVRPKETSVPAVK